MRVAGVRPVEKSRDAIFELGSVVLGNIGESMLHEGIMETPNRGADIERPLSGHASKRKPGILIYLH
jgi:hypothetical protein